MKTTSVLAAACLAIGFPLAAAAAPAEEQPLRFVRALQQRGYGDMAVEYLKDLQKRSDLPAGIRDVLDLEMSRSLKAAAATAFDAKEYDSLMEQSQEYLAKFIKEKPDHPEATTAVAAWGDSLAKRALESLRSAKIAEGKDKQQYEKFLAEARAGLGDARDKLRQAEKKFETRLAELPSPSKPPARKAERNEAADARQRAEENLRETQLQLALIEYYLAQTCADPKGGERTAALKKAAQALDDVYQRDRGGVAGVCAHLWHGKTVEELGDLQTALDIYDEVLAAAPEPSERGPATGLEPLFAQAGQFRLAIVAKQRPRQFLPEATAWLSEYVRLRQTDGYQGVALDVAKAMLAAAQEASGAKKTKLTADALKLATDCSKVRSQHQRELVLMRREILKLSGRETEANSFEEAVALGDAAAAGSDWQQALAAYGKAIELAEMGKLKNPAGIAAVRQAVSQVRLTIARELFSAGKFEECIETVGKVVRDRDGNVNSQEAASAQASALGVAAALNLYVAAPEAKKPAALERLIKVAEFTEQNWPERPEADDARMARGQAKVSASRPREAIEIFDRVNPKSERYAAAMYMAAENYWRLYLIEKSKPGGPADKEQMAADRGKAHERLVAALAAFNSQVEPGRPTPRFMPEAQLLLAEVLCERGEVREAVGLYRPLVERIKAEKPQTRTNTKAVDNNTIRIFLGAVRAYSALGEFDKAGQAVAVLTELGPDARPVNDVMMEFARLLNLERKKADALVTELEGGGKADQLAAAKTRLASVRELLGKTLVELSQRKELGLGNMVFIGETLNTIGMTAEAGRQFQEILKRAQSDPQFANSAQKAMSLIRTELLKALRKQQQYDEALKQVDQLIKENPRALEPLMEKGRILEAWAEKDPKKFDSAVGHWAMLRGRLQAMRKRPDEYYEVMYNVAKCLVREAETTGERATALDRAKKAEQVLKAALVLSPKLNGPDTVAKYKVLLAKAIAMQGRSPEQKDGKKP